MPVSFNTNSFKVDIKDDGDSYLVEAELPGVEKETINVDYDNNYLTISAKRDNFVGEKRKVS